MFKRIKSVLNRMTNFRNRKDRLYQPHSDMAKTRKAHRLATKVIVPLSLFLLIALAAILLIAFRHEQTENVHNGNLYLKLTARSILMNCERNFETLADHGRKIRSRNNTDDIKNLTIRQIRDFLLSLGLDGIVMRDNILLLSTFPSQVSVALHESSGPIKMSMPDGSYYGYYCRFSPWNWYLVTFIHENKYLSHEDMSYNKYILWLLLTFVLSVAGIIFLLQKIAIEPLYIMLGNLHDQGKITFHSGIREFDVLSDTINASIDELSKLKNAMDQAGESIIIADLDGNIEYVNPAYEKLTGYGKSELLKQNLRFFHSDMQSHEFYEGLWSTILSGRAWEGSLINKKKTGEFYREEMLITPVKDGSDDITHFIAIKKDVTEQQKLQQQLMHAQKMESVGVIAGGIAHEFKNDLTVILSFAEIILQDRSLNPETAYYLGIIKQSAQKSSETVKQLLRFARRNDFKPAPIDINALLSDTVRMFSKMIPQSISIKTEFQETLPLIRGDAGQLETILLNLLINARDAMPKGGEILLKTGLVELKKGDLGLALVVKAGTYLYIIVSDTGSGIADEHLPHIFEPFYTTKERGKGTGLGLAIAYGIIKDHNGYIIAQSKLNQGTAFTIHLPVLPEQKTDAA